MTAALPPIHARPDPAAVRALLAAAQGERDARDLAPGVRADLNDAEREQARDRAQRSSGRASVSFPPLRQRRLVAPQRLVVVHPHAILATPPAALALDRRLGWKRRRRYVGCSRRHGAHRRPQVTIGHSSYSTRPESSGPSSGASHRCPTRGAKLGVTIAGSRVHWGSLIRVGVGFCYSVAPSIRPDRRHGSTPPLPYRPRLGGVSPNRRKSVQPLGHGFLGQNRLIFVGSGVGVGRNQSSAGVATAGRIGGGFFPPVCQKQMQVGSRLRTHSPEEPTDVEDDAVDCGRQAVRCRGVLDGTDRVREVAVRDGLPAHELERSLWHHLLQLGHDLQAAYFALAGDSDCGATLQLADGRVVKQLPEPHRRPYQSIFGECTLERVVYGTREGQRIEAVPLDARLGLPEGRCSYVLRDWNQALVVENPYVRVDTVLERILGFKPSVASLETMTRTLAGAVAGYEAARPPAAPAAGAQLVVLSADGKGVPLRKPADAPAIAAHGHARGPKPDRKKMAVLGVAYQIEPHVRTPLAVVEALSLGSGASVSRSQQRPGPEVDESADPGAVERDGDRGEPLAATPRRAQ